MVTFDVAEYLLHGHNAEVAAKSPDIPFRPRNPVLLIGIQEGFGGGSTGGGQEHDQKG